jgi:hypothetical protein
MLATSWVVKESEHMGGWLGGWLGGGWGLFGLTALQYSLSYMGGWLVLMCMYILVLRRAS